MATLTSLTIIPDEIILYLGETIQLQCIANYDDGTSVDITDIATFSIYTTSPPFVLAEFGAEIADPVVFISTDDVTFEDTNDLLWQVTDDSTRFYLNGLLYTKSLGAGTVTANYASLYDYATITVHEPLVVELPVALVGKYRPLKEEYLGLITSQYQTSPKFMHWVRTYLEMMEDIRELATSLPYYFSFNRIVENPEGFNPDVYLTTKEGVSIFDFTEFSACVGVQLDIIGDILGQPRKVTFNPTDGSSPVLLDDDYRILLMNRIMYNQWKGNMQAMQEFWKVIFPGGKIIVQDNQNMTIDVTLTGDFTSIFVDLITNDYIVPRPQGVLCNYIYGTLPFYGHDRRDAYISGLDEGNWA
jgi:hypothetical protein